MHDKFKLYRARSGYIRAITITFTLIVILYPFCGAVRFNLSAWRRSHRALTPAPAHHHTQYGLSPFLTLPARRNAVLTIRATYCIWLFLDLFLRLLHLHRIVCQSVPATPSLYYHSTKHISSLVRSSVVDLSIFH